MSWSPNDCVYDPMKYPERQDLVAVVAVVTVVAAVAAVAVVAR